MKLKTRILFGSLAVVLVMIGTGTAAGPDETCAVIVRDPGAGIYTAYMTDVPAAECRVEKQFGDDREKARQIVLSRYHRAWSAIKEHNLESECDYTRQLLEAEAGGLPLRLVCANGWCNTEAAYQEFLGNIRVGTIPRGRDEIVKFMAQRIVQAGYTQDQADKFRLLTNEELPLSMLYRKARQDGDQTCVNRLYNQFGFIRQLYREIPPAVNRDHAVVVQTRHVGEPMRGFEGPAFCTYGPGATDDLCSSLDFQF